MNALFHIIRTNDFAGDKPHFGPALLALAPCRKASGDVRYTLSLVSDHTSL